MLALASLYYYPHHKGLVPFFENLSVAFDAGCIHAISGKNGVGKSTLLRILHGDNVPESGIITVYDKQFNLTHSSARTAVKKEIGFVPQQANSVIIPELTVSENLQLASITHMKLLSKLPTFDSSLIALFNISLDTVASTLSGGQKHILAIAMVLQQERSVLLFDEPIAALDDENAALVLACIASVFKKGITVIIVTHDQLTIDAPIHAWNLVLTLQGTRILVSKK